MANHSAYEFTSNVTAKDTYEGLQAASQLFVDYTLSRLESVKQLHIILLVVSLALMAGFVLLLYRPFIRLLHRDTKAVVCMLSQLPAEVDVEAHVRAIVLGVAKAPAAAAGDAAGNRSSMMMMMGGGDPAGGGPMVLYGPGGGMAAAPCGRGGMMWGGGVGQGGSPGAGGRGWFGGRGSDAGGGGGGRAPYPGFYGGGAQYGGGPNDMA